MPTSAKQCHSHIVLNFYFLQIWLFFQKNTESKTQHNYSKHSFWRHYLHHLLSRFVFNFLPHLDCNVVHTATPFSRLILFLFWGGFKFVATMPTFLHSDVLTPTHLPKAMAQQPTTMHHLTQFLDTSLCLWMEEGVEVHPCWCCFIFEILAFFQSCFQEPWHNAKHNNAEHSTLIS